MGKRSTYYLYAAIISSLQFSAETTSSLQQGNLCNPCSFLCSCEDEEYFDWLDDSTRDQAGNLDDRRYWSSDDEGEDQEVVTEVGAVDNESETLGGLLGGLNEGSLKHSLNLDGHMELYSEEGVEEAADTEVGLAVTEVGAVDVGAGKQVSGGSHSGLVNIVRSGGEVGTKEPDPPYPPDIPSESDSDKEDAGYGSGADSTVHKSERAVVWFPPSTGGSSQKRNNQSRFSPGFQGETLNVTNLTKRRKVQVILTELLDGASLLPESCPPAVSVSHADTARPVTRSSSVPGLNQSQFASVTQPYSQAHMSLPPGAAGEGDQPEEEKDKRALVCYTPGKATRMYVDSSNDGLRVTVAQAYLDGPVLQWKSVYEMSRNWSTPERVRSQVKQECAAHQIGMISSNGYLRGLKPQARVAFKPLIFSRNLMRVAGYEISFLTDIFGKPPPPLHLDRLSVNSGGPRGGLHNCGELGPRPRVRGSEGQPGGREKQKADSDKRRSRRLLNRQGVSSIAGLEAERGQ